MMGRRTTSIPAKMRYVSSLPPPFCHSLPGPARASRCNQEKVWIFLPFYFGPALLVKVIRVPHQAKCQTERQMLLSLPPLHPVPHSLSTPPTHPHVHTHVHTPTSTPRNHPALGWLACLCKVLPESIRLFVKEAFLLRLNSPQFCLCPSDHQLNTTDITLFDDSIDTFIHSYSLLSTRFVYTRSYPNDGNLVLGVSLHDIDRGLHHLMTVIDLFLLRQPLQAVT
ncbi:uncharacterized protein LY79DRAFT_72532 [Colletotrichum navitas]|uniref:Uncharacterized protein n=1 Tax=Colletotrichum navitas TaxID=681940 RepID=A0AAD8PKY9_9PEZI|nr:uncharacterized protein LY79DRAFT_72532 [Colletotrichum navitas]KAK1569585.1 hypothetical protein LY79DRAFT_72532 [Colletotrichum navitas]